MFWTPLLTVFNGVPLYTKGVTFLLKMEYKRVRGWTSGRSLPDKTLLITLPLRGGLEPLRPCRSLSARICKTKLFTSRKVRSEFDFFKIVFYRCLFKEVFSTQRQELWQAAFKYWLFPGRLHGHLEPDRFEPSGGIRSSSYFSVTCLPAYDACWRPNRQSWQEKWNTEGQ